MNPDFAAAPQAPVLSLRQFRVEYGHILQDYIAQEAEAQLLRANQLGKRAFESGVSLLDVAAAHVSWLAETLKLESTHEPARVVERTRSVLLECLAPFELTVRGFKDILDETKRKTERDVAAIFASAKDGVVVFREDGTVTGFNNALADMLGYTVDELRARMLSERARGRPSLIEGAALNQLAERGYFDGYERECLRSDGTPLIATVSGARIGSWQEGHTWRAFAFVRDITEPKRAEQTIRESEERYRTLFEAGGTSNCVVVADLRISSCNLELTRLTGRAATEIEGRDLRELVHEEDVEPLDRAYGDILEGGSEGPAHFKARLIRSDGSSADVIAFLALLPDRVSVLVSFADITLEKAYEKQLEERAKQLTDFLSIASHELGLPLTIIKGYAQTLAQHLDALSKEETAEILGSINASADRLNHLVQELLDVSRVETGRVVLQPQVVQLESLLGEVIKDMQMRADEHLFDLRAAAGVDTVGADPAKLRQVVMILLDNASRFSPRNSLIEIETAGEGEGVVISVLDRGVGVAPQDREWIFEPFSQVEDVDHHSSSGLGLGLYIASRIVAAHGGRMWHEERPGGGSAFRLLLPWASGETAAE